MRGQKVKLVARTLKDGVFVYMLDFVDTDLRRRRISLGHFDKRKAEMQRQEKERDLLLGVSETVKMMLDEFAKDCLERTRGQVRETTLAHYGFTVRFFIEAVGNIYIHQVKLEHGERFIQFCIDKGNSESTISKHIRQMKRLFQLGVNRGQLPSNPLSKLKELKFTPRPIRTLSPDECSRIFKAVVDLRDKLELRWDLMVGLALSIGLRKGEILNLTWWDIDFEKKLVEVKSKKETAETWSWQPKDSEIRILPLAEPLVSLFAAHQNQQAEGLPYVFLTKERYERIQAKRKAGKWNCFDSLSPVSSFTKQFQKILKTANIEPLEFHDLRRTALSNFFYSGLDSISVQKIAGHSNLKTTASFYLAIRPDLIEKARQASSGFVADLAHLWHTAPSGSNNEKS